jgi:hypothetical protein
VSSIPVVPGKAIVAAPSGSLYWNSASVPGTANADVVIFDPTTEAVVATFPAVEGTFVLDPVSGQLCFVSSDVSKDSLAALTAAVPSETILGSGPTGDTVGTIGGRSLSGAYDRKDNLILLPDFSDDVDILDAATLATKGYIPLGTYSAGNVALQVLFANEGYVIVSSAVPTGGIGEVVKFDPVSAQITGTLQVPLPAGPDIAGVVIAQAAASGTNLYVPLYPAFDPGCDITLRRSSAPAGAYVAVIDTQTLTVSSYLPVPTAGGYYLSLNGFAISPITGTAYLSLTQIGLLTLKVYYELLEIDLQTGVPLRVVELPAGNLAISPDGSTLYTTQGGGPIEAISVETLTVTMSGPDVGAFALTPDGQYIYACTSTGVDIITTSTLTLTAAIPSTSPTCSTPIFVEY